MLAASLALPALVGCTSLPEHVERPASYAYTDTDGTTLGQARRDEIRRHPGESGFLLLGNGLDAFVAEQQDSAYLRALRDSDLANRIRAHAVRYDWGPAQVVQDDPEKVLVARSDTAYQLAPQLRPYFTGVEDELYIFSPYFVPGKQGTALLTDLSRRGFGCG